MSNPKNPLELKLSKKPKAITTADFAHLDNVSPADWRAAMANVAMIQRHGFPKVKPMVIGPHSFDHLNGEEFAAQAKADAIVAAGKARRGETEAPKATGLAAKIISAAKRVVRL
jgi:hypothetical protein